MSEHGEMPPSSLLASTVVQFGARSSITVSLPLGQAPGTTPAKVWILMVDTPGPASVNE
ncbi:MAG: hypothetical protein R3F14_25495 [Polyangiaceae bacterium]